MTEDSLTILKYMLDGEYKFHVMDKFDEIDEPARLDKMIDYSAGLEMTFGDKYKQLWIKTCPVFPVQ